MGNVVLGGELWNFLNAILRCTCFTTLFKYNWWFQSLDSSCFQMLQNKPYRRGGGPGILTNFKTGFFKDLRLLQNKGGGKDNYGLMLLRLWIL